MISGPVSTLRGLRVDGDDDHDHALLGEHAAVAQDALADVADDAVDVQVAGRHPSDRGQSVVGELEHVAVLAQQHVVVGDTHRPPEPGVGDEMAILAVDRHVVVGPHDRQVGLDLVGLGVPGGVDVDDAGVDDLGAGAQQAVDDAVDVALVAGDRVTRQDHRVVVAELDELVLDASKQRERRHRLALRSGGDHAHLAGLVAVDVLDVDHRRLGRA